MSQQILQVDQAMLETTLDRMVRKSVEETLNAMLDAEADEITGAARYERSGDRLIDMYLAGVSTRQVDDVSRLLWGDRMPSQTLSDKLKRVYADIVFLFNRKLRF